MRWGGIIASLLLAGCVAAPESAIDPPLSGPAGVSAHAGWSEFALPGKRRTRYDRVWIDGRHVVRADADSSASMFRRKIRLDPEHLGNVRFSWRVSELIAAADLRDRDAADSPVRVLLAFDGDRKRLSPRDRAMFELAQVMTGEAPPYATLMYVWDNHAPLEAVIPGGRSDRVQKIVLESGARHLGQWRHYERDIVADFRRAFGEDPGPLIAVGYMTDADNTASRASAWYGDVHLCGRHLRQC